jgi:hypothetical protein
MLVLHGDGNRNWRIIATDGRPLAQPADVVSSYYGTSVGRWTGDTLVVDSVGYNEKFWFHAAGLPHTEALHLTERFTRTDLSTLKYEVTVDDPRTELKPWTMNYDAVDPEPGTSGVFLRGEDVMMRRTLGIVDHHYTAVLLASVPALAHHSFDAEYDSNKVATIAGFVTKARWQNPHAFVYIDAQPSGAVKSFRVEMGRPTRSCAAGGRRTR